MYLSVERKMDLLVERTMFLPGEKNVPVEDYKYQKLKCSLRTDVK